MARAVGRPDRVRAVAAAVGRTSVPILVRAATAPAPATVPLTGYLDGLRRKQALLDLEACGAAGLSPEQAWAFRQLALK